MGRGTALKELLRKAKALWDEFATINAGTHASSIAYFSFLSLPPTLAICISLVSLLGVSEADVGGLVSSLVPDALEELVQSIVSHAYANSGIAFSLSTITLLWSASKGAKALRGGLNATFSVRENRNAVAVAIISIVAIVLLGIMIAAVLYLIFSNSVMNALGKIAPSLRVPEPLEAMLSPVVVVVAGVLIIDVCYAFLPAGKRRPKTQLPGAFFATLSCGVVAFGFRLYVDYFCNYDALYGSIGAVAMLLFWMYLAGYIIMAGAFVNRVLAEREADASTALAE